MSIFVFFLLLYEITLVLTKNIGLISFVYFFKQIDENGYLFKILFIIICEYTNLIPSLNFKIFLKI